MGSCDISLNRIEQNKFIFQNIMYILQPRPEGAFLFCPSHTRREKRPGDEIVHFIIPEGKK